LNLHVLLKLMSTVTLADLLTRDSFIGILRSQLMERYGTANQYTYGKPGDRSGFHFLKDLCMRPPTEEVVCRDIRDVARQYGISPDDNLGMTIGGKRYLAIVYVDPLYAGKVDVSLLEP
jgi:hypothetical protein